MSEISGGGAVEREPNIRSGIGPILRSGRSVALVPVRPEHTEFLYHLATDDSSGWRWRCVGTVPRRDVFEQTIWNGVLTQFIVQEKKLGGMIGTVFAYNADLNQGTAYVAVGMLPEATGSGIGIEATDLFVAHLFGCYRLRKLYFEVPQYNITQFGSALDGLLKEEGRLRDHSYYNYRFWDKFILTLDCGDYQELAENGRMFGRRRRPKSSTPGEAGVLP